MLIGGQRGAAAAGRTFETVDPATGETLAHVAAGEAEDVDRAVSAASKAFEDRPWPRFFSRDLEPITAYDGYWYAWDEAHEQATMAYEAWCKDRTRRAYTVYLAAQERADAAESALARQAQAAPGER